MYTFTLILVYIIMSFSLFFYFADKKDKDDPISNPRHIWAQVKLVSTYITGGFDFGEGEEEQNKAQTVGQIVVIYIGTILMMNLLVGILSEKLGDIMATRVISSFRLLLEICIENETHSSLFPPYYNDDTNR